MESSSQQPSLQTYTPLHNVTNRSQPTIIGRLDKHDRDIKRQGRISDWTLALTVGISVVCFIAFTTFIIQAWQFYTNALEENTKAIEDLKNEKSDLKESQLNNRIDSLEKELELLKLNSIASQSAVISN